MSQRQESKEGEGEARIVVGVHAVTELLRQKPKAVRELYVADGPRRGGLDALVQEARAAGVAVHARPMRVLDAKAQGLRHQGAIAITDAFPYVELADVLIALTSASRALVVLLDSVQDPQNLGAVVRSACAFGADLVVIPKDRAAQVTPLVERASAGTTALLPIARVTNLKRAMEQLKEAGLWLVGAGTRDGSALDRFTFAEKIGLVIGGEGEGLRQGVAAGLDFVVTIPIMSRVESLNASNAAAVMLYEIARQRGPAHR